MAEKFPGNGSHLERYAAQLNAVEINSSFYRPHRRTTYERWAASVPAHFRFAIKLPRTITHERRLADSDDLSEQFASEVAGLAGKRGPVLVQLPPSLIFDAAIADAFFSSINSILGGAVVCEPRHRSWFEATADDLFIARGIARVAADPARTEQAEIPGGRSDLRYTRLHGSPRIYWSPYDDAAVARHAEAARDASVESWTIYDNTASGAATANAIEMRNLIDR
ncbi:DUF72 domain-containing protein [Sphingomonas sp.]|uniref:DUF72 domain-containing protein n=1 Tax=Sphingomonas sp. TaxID=28214 RepID=UPI003D6DA7F4